MNEQDRQAREIVRQARPAAAGSRLMAGSAGATSQSAGATTTRVDAQGKVRRMFLMGDDWSDRFYFKNWKAENE